MNQAASMPAGAPVAPVGSLGPDAQTVRWVTAQVLQTLAAQGLAAGAAFTSSQLQAWLGDALTPEQRVHATTRLCGLLFIAHQGKGVYELTAEGAAAVAEAGAGRLRKSGPKGSRTAPPPRPGTLATRLWALVRVRGIVDTDSAARTLCDAGEGDFNRLRATVARTLRRWELAGALAPRAKRLHAPGQSVHSNGCKGYVLLSKSPTPPHWVQARKKAAP